MEIASKSAGKLYGAALAASRPVPEIAPGLETDESAAPTFSEAVSDVAQQAVDTLVQGERTAEAMMAGKADAQAVVEALAATEMALEMAVSIRDKVVEAYQEILRMPV